MALSFAEYTERMRALTAAIAEDLKPRPITDEHSISDEAARLDGVRVYGAREREALRITAGIPLGRHRAARRRKRAMRSAAGMV